MSVTTERMQRLMRDEMADPPAKGQGADEEKFLTDLRSDIQKATAQGISLEIPAEWPGADDGEKSDPGDDRVALAKANAEKRN